MTLWLGSGGTSVDQAQENPESVTHLFISDDGLKEWPAYIKDCTNLEALDASDNSLEEISMDLRDLPKIRKIELVNNPIKVLPEWLIEMEALEDLDISGTMIDSTSVEIIRQLKARDVDVIIENTPLALSIEKDEVQIENEPEEDEHAEGFMEFAKRKLLYGGDDYRRKYGKGEIYYDGNIEIALVDSLGAALTDIGLFSDEKEVSVKVVKVDKLYQVKVVTIYESAVDLTEEEHLSWQLITAMIASRTFDGEKMEVHLCDTELNVLTEIPSK